MKRTIDVIFIVCLLLLSAISVSTNTSEVDPIQCGLNEHIKDSGIVCQTCSNYQYVKCAPIYKRQCYCLDGYVRRDDNKQCTAIEDCPKITHCGDN